MILHGDCLTQLKTLDANSVDSLVTDPPAGISFMGKDWDGDKGGRAEWIAWMRDVMRECLRVLKPGAHGLVWALPRTSHWTAIALEDAGFEIRDCVYHLFGQGFPKSLDVSKAIDKAAGAKREVVATKRKTPSFKNDETNTDSSNWDFGSSKLTYEAPITAPATEAAKQWSGWGTALKPAVECWWLVRKPLSEKTVAANVLKWGTGAINIAASRIGFRNEADERESKTKNQHGKFGSGPMTNEVYGKFSKDRDDYNPPGRFPSHLLLDEHAAEMLDALSGKCRSSGHTNKSYQTASATELNYNGKAVAIPGVNTYSDSGGASRFFYCAKISPSERNAGLEGMPDKFVATMNGGIGGREHSPDEPTAYKKNHHPTVKPLKLMRYLCRMVTPPGGLVLDPFTGSGSTGVAALQEGFRFVGIEREIEYVAIAEKRIEAVNA